MTYLEMYELKMYFFKTCASSGVHTKCYKIIYWSIKNKCWQINRKWFKRMELFFNSSSNILCSLCEYICAYGLVSSVNFCFVILSHICCIFGQSSVHSKRFKLIFLCTQCRTTWVNIVKIVSIEILYDIKRKQEKRLAQELAPKTTVYWNNAVGRIQNRNHRMTGINTTTIKVLHSLFYVPLTHIIICSKYPAKV